MTILKFRLWLLSVHTGGDNDKDALDRLNYQLCDTAIAVNIPLAFEKMSEDEAAQELRKGDSLFYALLQRENDDHIFVSPNLAM